jgi:hypothetical protein
LVRLATERDLTPVAVPSFKPVATRASWIDLPPSFLEGVGNHIAWCATPDPLEERARARPLSLRSRRLRREQIHSAVTAAIAAGVRPERLASPAALVDLEVVKTALGQM